MKKYTILLLFIFFLTNVICCQRIYFTGMDDNEPCFWQGNSKTTLTAPANPVNIKPQSIYVTKHIYVGGYYYQGANIGCIWKDGTRQDFQEENSRCHSVFVRGNDVYGAGEYTFRDTLIACYWKNNQVVNLSSLTSTAKSIFIKNQDVLVAGYTVTSIPRACYWQNTTYQPLPHSPYEGSYAESIHRDNSHVYTCGRIIVQGDFRPCYWQDTALVILPCPDGTSHGYANDIISYKNNIYTCGWYYIGNKRVACYWKNNNRIDLTGDNSNGSAFTIQVVNDNIFVAGYIDNSNSNGEIRACYWKNNTLNIISGNTSTCLDMIITNTL